MTRKDKAFEDLVSNVLMNLSPSYSVANWAAACDLGETTIREHIADSNLVTRYPTTSKAIVTLEDGLAWLRTLPTEPPKRAS